MDWFKGNFTGKPHISWENLWFPVDFPLNQSIDFHHPLALWVLPSSAKPSHRTSTASVEIEVREVSLRRAVRRRGEWQTLRQHHVGCWFAYIYNILHI